MKYLNILFFAFATFLSAGMEDENSEQEATNQQVDGGDYDGSPYNHKTFVDDWVKELPERISDTLMSIFEKIYDVKIHR